MPWRPEFPRWRRPLGYLRLLRARHRFHDRLRPGWKRSGGGLPRPGLVHAPGDRSRLASLRDSRCGETAFVLGNGPSLLRSDLSALRNRLTIGSNGIYTRFAELGFATTFLLFEDLEQTQRRGADIPRIRGPLKLAALHNAYAFRADRSTCFFHARAGDPWYWAHLAPRFSEDFSEIVYLGSTVTTIALQLAFHLGCTRAVLVGVDHDYGELASRFPPGKLRVTAENLELVRACHFDPGYTKIGDLIGVPHVAHQEAAYREARRVFEARGRRIHNATAGGKLEIFERVSLADAVANR